MRGLSAIAASLTSQSKAAGSWCPRPHVDQTAWNSSRLRRSGGDTSPRMRVGLPRRIALNRLVTASASARELSRSEYSSGTPARSRMRLPLGGAVTVESRHFLSTSLGGSTRTGVFMGQRGHRAGVRRVPVRCVAARAAPIARGWAEALPGVWRENAGSHRLRGWLAAVLGTRGARPSERPTRRGVCAPPGDQVASSPMPQPACRFCARPSRTRSSTWGCRRCARASCPPSSSTRWSPSIRSTCWVCDACFLVQLQEYVTPEHIFTEYAYFSSYSTAGWSTPRTTSRWSAIGCRSGRDSFVVELASNDGYLLQYFVQRGVPCLGHRAGRQRGACGGREGGRDPGGVLRRGHGQRARRGGPAGRPDDRQQRPRPGAGPQRLRRRAADPAEADRGGDDGVPAPGPAHRGQPVRHDLPRALLVLLAAGGGADLRRPRPDRLRRRGAPDARRLAPGLGPAGGGRLAPGQRPGRSRCADRRTAAGLARLETYAMLRGAGPGDEAPPARVPDRRPRARASASPATAPRARATRSSTTAASAPTSSTTPSTATRTSTASSCPGPTSRSTPRRASRRPVRTTSSSCPGT